MVAKILIRRQKKEFVPELNREVTTVKAKQYFVVDVKQPLHTSDGVISATELQKPDGSKVLTNSTKKEFTLLTAQFIDVYKRLRKLPQTIPLKDLGFIAAETGINKESVVVDAGTGSAALACFFANLVKQVITYELREDFLGNIQRNIEFLNLKNVTVKNKSVYECVDETNVDLITLDLPEPWQAISAADKALKIGGFIVNYSPTVPQIMDFVAAVEKNTNFLVVKTVEVTERLWETNGRRVRPKSIAIGHSGFLTFVRKIC